MWLHGKLSLKGRKVTDCECEVGIKNESGGIKRILGLTIYTSILALVGDQDA